MRITTLLLAALLLAATDFAHSGISRPRSTEAAQGELYVPRPELARLSALGFDSLLADYYWLQAVQIVGGSATDPSAHARTLGRLIDVVTTLDPWVDHPYRFAAVWLTDSEESVRTANRLLERGVAYHPADWRNRFYLGFNHYFYLGENGAAADVLEGAVTLPGAPRYLRRLVARLRGDTKGLEVAAAMLRDMIEGTQDPYTRAELEKALDEIETERRARFLDAARAEYQRRRGRDLERVEDLLAGPEPVLRRLPEELHGFEWVLDERSGRIVSSYYRRRYEPYIHDTDRVRRERWRAQREGREG